MISQDQAKERLTGHLDQIPLLRNKKSSEHDFLIWRRDTKITIKKIFGEESSHVSEFSNIIYSSYFGETTNSYSYYTLYNQGLDRVESLLQSMINELDTWGISDDSVSTIDPIIEIKRICDRFHKVARQIKSRHDGRDTLSIDDEYDVQDLFHSLLCLYFDDIRPEEGTPSYAAGSSRVDFLIKDINTVIEIKIKHSKQKKRDCDLANELMVDIQRYQSHPKCEKLIFFVYDPESLVSNPRGIENDLNGDRDGISVTVFIRPE